MITHDHQLRIYISHARRHFPALCRMFYDDVRQEAMVLLYSHSRKHLTVRECQRLAGRHFYRIARAYGFQRIYAPGNRKTALQKMEVYDDSL